MTETMRKGDKEKRITWKERKRQDRARKRAEGLIDITVWIRPEFREKLKRLEKRYQELGI